METTGSHKIYIEGRWEIRDLYMFPHRYAELVIRFCMPLRLPENLQTVCSRRHSNAIRGKAVTVLSISMMCFYGAIPREERPQIKRIEYASPGYIELGAVTLLVTQIDRILTTVFKLRDKLDRIYDGIHKRYVKRRLAKIDLKNRERKLAEEDLYFTVEACKELSQAMGLEGPEALHKLTGNPLASLKILMAFYRRLSELVSFIHEGKVKITPGDQKKTRGFTQPFSRVSILTMNDLQKGVAELSQMMNPGTG